MIKRSLSILVVCLLLCTANAMARPADDQAAAIFQATGVQGGLIVHLGCGDGTLTAALQASDSYLVHALDTNPAKVAKARRHIESLGLYGPVSIDHFDGPRLPYIDNLVNLVVAEDLGNVSMDEVNRVLAPLGVAYIKSDGKWIKTIKPRPNSMDNWPHFLHGADGNAVADDTAVDAPQHLQWFGGPHYTKGHNGVASVNVVVSDGRRIFYIADDADVALPEQLPSEWSLIARDAFNGVPLWKRPLSIWQARNAGSRHLFPPDLFRRLVAGEQHVYATLSIMGPVSALDPATGETIREYNNTVNSQEILFDRGVLYLVVDPASPDTVDRRLLAGIVPSRGPKKLMAIKPDTGRVLWTRNDEDTLGLIIMSTAVSNGALVFQTPRDVVCLDAPSGKTRWKTSRPSPEIRPVWGTPTVIIADDVVLSADRTGLPNDITPEEMKGDAKDKIKTAWNASTKNKSELIAYDLKSGKKLWSTPSTEASHIPNEVFVVKGLVWAGEQSGRSQQDYRFGRDLHTGEIKVTIPPSKDWVSHHHHRCYRDKATSRFILAGRTGVEFIDLQSGQLKPHHWIRGICKFGVLPCNGMLYIPPNQCSCYIESLLHGFHALAPARQMPAALNKPRTEKGPAYGQVAGDKPDKDDWPTYRSNPARTGSTADSLPPSLKEHWETELTGRLTAPVVSQGRVYVAAIDKHTVYALDSESGKTQWTYTAGARIDSPPTIAEGLVVFGCRDGKVYALKATDGVLVWRYLAAPNDQRLVSDGQCESVWPVHGSVLIEDSRVYLAAGRYSHLDGGILCSILDLKTGEKIVEQRHYSRDAQTGAQKSLYEPFAGAMLPDRELPGIRPDVPASDGKNIFMRSVAFDRSFNTANEYVQHMFASAGFLDGEWYERLFWIYGNHLFSGLAGRGFNRDYPSTARILVQDETTLYGYRDYTQTNEGLFAIDKTQSLGVFDSEYPVSKKASSKARSESELKHPVSSRWHLDVPFYVRSMVATQNSIVLAGPPKHQTDAVQELIAESATDTNPLPPILQHALDAWRGEKGGQLWTIDKKNGTKQTQYELDSPPVHDGMAVAAGRLYISTMNGKVLCLGKN